ncbi:MAG: glycosyl transferase [Herminiimonas sp.]|nr:glycosyl transferase [Herminiimonas sp.]
MKLLIFTNDLSAGGAERVAASLANYWAGSDWKVTLVTLGPESHDFYPLHRAIERISLDLSGHSKNFMVGLLQNLRRVVALRSTLRQTRPDVALALMSTPNVLLALASHGVAGLTAIGSERSFPPRLPLGRAWNAMREKTYGKLAAVVALTEECADWVKLHSTAKLVPVIPNPISWPLQQHEPRIAPDSICRKERKVLLAVGRLAAEKNLELLIQVFAELAPDHAEWDLIILGEGPERPVLEAQVRATALSGRVHLPGLAGNMGEWYARADLYVLSSRFEGFPNALAEALAHGVPAVSVDCDTGPRDIVRHGVDGLLVAAGDEDGLKTALNRLMQDSEFRAALGLRAAEARTRFSIQRVAGMWEKLFDLLSEKDRAARPEIATRVKQRYSR